MSTKNKYPIYVVSKGRANSRLTVKALQDMNADFYIVIEEQEFDQYAEHIDKKHILILDKSYQDNYDTLDDLGETKSKGPGAARNFAWQHSIDNNHTRHWVMDDNINGFSRLNNNAKIKLNSTAGFKAMEDFTDRYTNVSMSGPNYDFFAKARQKIPPFICNTRIYSCNLILNELPFRWRGRYNEDTILSLDMLKAGFCTIQFNAFLQNKVKTQSIKGGNTKEFYEKEGTKPKSQMQVEVHPDVSRLTWKFGRWHHEVDYKPFRNNKLIKRKDVVVKDRVNDYGLKLVNKQKVVQ